MTLHDCGMALLHPHAANYFLSGKRPAATGNPHPNLAPYSKFRTKTCEIFVAAGNDPAFRKFCEFLGMPEMAKDPRFATNGARVTNRAALTEVLEARFAEEDGHDLTRRMLQAGLPAGPVRHVDEAMAAPHTAHRQMVTELDGYRGLGTPIKMSPHPGRHPRRAAALRRAHRGGAGAARLLGRGDRRAARRRRAGGVAAEVAAPAPGRRLRTCHRARLPRARRDARGLHPPRIARFYIGITKQRPAAAIEQPGPGSGRRHGSTGCRGVRAARI